MQDERSLAGCSDDVNMRRSMIVRINYDAQASEAENSRHFRTISKPKRLGKRRSSDAERLSKAG
jgi:hypothetical protein